MDSMSMYHLDHAATDFDQWLDWNGNADRAYEGSRSQLDGTKQFHTVSPPSSSPESSAAMKHAPFDRSRTDLPTPTNSSASPETPCLPEPRLSGETLREKVPIIATRPLLKRKLSAQNIPSAPSAQDFSDPPAKKRPHNVIEKRYRANLNERIAELRDSVPSLRALKKTQPGEDGAGSENEELHGLVPSNKLNKASILTKAVEYIKYLEGRSKRLDDENKLLKERLRTLDKVLANGGDGAQRATAFTSSCVIEETTSSTPTSQVSDGTENKQAQHYPPEGLIPVPESMRRLRQAQPQEHYGHIYDTRSEGHGSSKKWPTRLLLGSIAGLMIMEGLNESDQSTTSREKGLFGIPLELLDGYRFLMSPRIYLASFSQFSRSGGAVPLMKGFAALSILAFILFAYLFNSKPISTAEAAFDSKTNNVQEPPTLTSPIEVRRRAWSTSMQTLRLPSHSFFAEWLALTFEWLKYTINYLFGYQAYYWATGRSEDDEIARVKAWDIAIDAQLNGGDPEVSRSRVVLTAFGSGTLPTSPHRLMLKALHCRVLHWRTGQPGSLSFRAMNKLARYFANKEWARARQLNSEAKGKGVDQLPTNLKALLQEECDAVLTDAVMQRAYNLMYDRPTNEHALPADSLMDVIVEDHAVRSPLDAMAAWWSSQCLRRTLELSLQPAETVCGLSTSVESILWSALCTSPPGSAAETRALALHAVFFSRQRHNFYLRALNALPQDYKGSGSHTPRSGACGPYFIDSSTPASACPDLWLVLHCAMTMGILESDGQTEEAIEHFQSLSLKREDITFLSFSAVYFVLQAFWRLDPTSSPVHLASTIQLFGNWLHSDEASMSNIPQEAAQMFDSMSHLSTGVRFKRRPSTVSNDTGYESQEEESERQSSGEGDKLPSLERNNGAGPHVSWV